MTPQEFADKMQQIANKASGPGRDLEATHGDADELMCNLLESLGYEEGVRIYVLMDKWYA